MRENKLQAAIAERRRKAEQKLATSKIRKNLGDMDQDRLVHELQVHQIELEMQNDELALACERSENANISKSAFLANMSHEIRTPINAIIGLAHLVARSGVTAEQETRLDKIKMAGEHLLEIINAILDLSKIESGKFELDETEVNLSEIVRNVLSMTNERAQDKTLNLVIEEPSKDYSLLGDPTRIQQALLNYMSNAIKFTESGSVTLRTLIQEESNDSVLVRFEVQDTGIGISGNNIKRLFSAFEQADSSITRKYGGSGLGLAITQKIAQQMGGNAGVSSVEGVGSTFWFTARLKRNLNPTSTKPERVIHSAEFDLLHEYPGRKILLVEDEPINQEIARELLFDAGQNIDIAVDGVDALNMFEQNPYDLILMDLQMPHMGGLEATSRIRNLPLGANIPIIAMTANAFTEDKMRCLEAGMSDFTTKPIDPDCLFSTVLKWYRKTATS